ncbi:MAG: hypothetical protein LBU34_00345 [Planctomycetaceae bacterium]|jgi:signal transduction histidine kinase|nr:hypothetical protein [Planctomycetaceae bacterium]
MIYFCSIIFSFTAAIVVVVVSSILMMLLTWTFWKKRMHQNSLLAAWVIFLLFIGLGLFYVRYSYMRVVNTHVKIYRDISQHCARVLQTKVHANQLDDLLWSQQYLDKCKKNTDIITSFYLIKQTETPLQSFAFFNLNTTVTDSTITDSKTAEPKIIEPKIAEPKVIEPEANLAIWRNIPLKLIFGQDYLPKPVADAFERHTTVVGIVKRTDYQERRLIFTTPIFGRNGVIQSVLCLEIREEDWLKEFLFVRILPHLFFFSFLFFFFTMQIILFRRRTIVKHLKENQITSFEQTLDHLISVKMSAEKKSIDRNYLIRQVDLEFKKPLIPILESSFLLRRQMQNSPNSLFEWGTQPENLALLEKMYWGCRKLKLVLNDIRTFIDFEWNQIDTQIEVFSPQQIIHNLRNICQQYLLEKSNIKFQIDTISAIPDLVRGDQQKIQHVLEELLEMVIDRMTNGHIKITCYMSDSQLCWIILDTGEMLTENQTRQLNEFYSGEWTYRAKTDGKLIFNFDFGSSIAAAFTYLLKGNISFQSTTGHGNKCTAAFPVEI